MKTRDYFNCFGKSREKLEKKLDSLNVPFCDFHTHSVNKYTNSYGKSSFPPSRKVLSAAEENGLKALGIADHSYEIVKYDCLDEKTVLNTEFNSFTPYINYLNKLKKSSKIPLIKGAELFIQNPEDAQKIDRKSLKELDFIILESKKSVDFKEIRCKIKNKPIILAHPAVDSFFNKKTDDEIIMQWLSSLKNNNIFFELNRSNFKQYLKYTELYSRFFKLAEKKEITFTIGSDFHLIPGDYMNFFSCLCLIAERFNISNFYNPNAFCQEKKYA